MQEAGVSFDRRITVYLHSPGGSVVEALKLGRLISKLKANTSVGRSSATSAECLSACVWAYLGGTYRFLPDTSEVGVHQFAFVNDKAVQTETATAVSQSMAAEIVEFMKQNRAALRKEIHTLEYGNRIYMGRISCSCFAQRASLLRGPSPETGS
jgi:hypothetical protein